MSCGNLILQDSNGAFWTLTCDVDGTLVVTLVSQVYNPYTAPIITSPSFYWQLSKGGAQDDIVLTSVPPTSISVASSYTLASPTGAAFVVVADDTGTLLVSSTSGTISTTPPFPVDVTMSVFPPSTGLTSTRTGNAPLILSADYSIWSCVLNQFINEDTTNIVVVVDE